MKAVLVSGMLFALGVALPAQPAVPAPADVASTNVVLTNIQQVVAFTNNPAAFSNTTARVRGVVTYVSSPTRRLYIQERGQAVQINLAGSIADFRPGQSVEATGKVASGVPYPRIVEASASIEAEEVPLPEAPSIHAKNLAVGEEAFRFVTARGVVRDMVSDANGLTLLLTQEHMGFEVFVPAKSLPLPRAWLDAELEIRGISFPTYNIWGNANFFRLHAQTTNFIHVTQAGVGSLFERPLLTIAEAGRLPQDWRPRVKIAGTVTVHRPSGEIYLEDETGVMFVVPMSRLAKPAGAQGIEHVPPTLFQPGDRIEVIGARHTFFSLTPTLTFADYRRVGTAPLPRPQKVSLADLQAGRYAGRVVQVEARLLDYRPWYYGSTYNQTLVLQIGESIFQANCETESSGRWDLKPDSYVRVTGVNEATQGRLKNRPMFQLLLRGPQDVAPASAPPFWTRPQVWKPGVAALGVGVIALAWVALLRRQVSRSTAQLRVANIDLRDQIDERTRAEKVQRATYQISEAVHAADDLKSFYARVHEVIRGLMRAENFFLLLHNPVTDLHEYVYHVDQMDAPPAPRRVSGGLVGYILRTGHSLLVDRASMTNPRNEWHSVSGTPSAIWLGVPLVVRGKTMGVMAVQDYENAAAYGEPEKQILTYVAEQAALAIERKHSDATLAESETRLRESHAEIARALEQERELNQLKSTFVSMVSHEFRTPLEVILSSSNILDRYLERLAPEKRAAQLRAIRKSVHRMNDLIDDVLLLGKFDAGALTCCPVPMDLGAFCRRVANEISSASGREGIIQVTIDPCINGDATADEGLLHHILGNLMSNAVKYSPPERTVELSVVRAGTEAQFTVRDRGCGIPPADQARLFTAFYRGSNVGQTPGSGLGLVITKRCVDLHGGTIACASEQGVGTTFTVTLPLFDGTRIFRRRAAMPTSH